LGNKTYEIKNDPITKVYVGRFSESDQASFYLDSIGNTASLPVEEGGLGLDTEIVQRELGDISNIALLSSDPLSVLRIFDKFYGVLASEGILIDRSEAGFPARAVRETVESRIKKDGFPSPELLFDMVLSQYVLRDVQKAPSQHYEP